MQKLGKVSAEKVVLHKTYGTARKALGIKDVARKGTPRQAATAFLKSIASQLKIPADLGNLKYDKTVKSPLGAHGLGNPYWGGTWPKQSRFPRITCRRCC